MNKYILILFLLSSCGDTRTIKNFITSQEIKNETYVHAVCDMNVDNNNYPKIVQIDTSSKIKFIHVFNANNYSLIKSITLIDSLPFNSQLDVCRLAQSIKLNMIQEYKIYSNGNVVIKEFVNGDTTKFIEYYSNSRIVKSVRYTHLGYDSTAYYFINGEVKGYSKGFPDRRRSE